MPDSPKFIHLRLHTEYSLLEGAVRLKKLPGMAAKAGMPAVAVTDTNNMFAALEFSVAARALASSRSLVVRSIWPTIRLRREKRPVIPRRWSCWRRARRVYENLMKLNSCLYLDEG